MTRNMMNHSSPLVVDRANVPLTKEGCRKFRKCVIDRGVSTTRGTKCSNAQNCPNMFGRRKQHQKTKTKKGHHRQEDKKGDHRPCYLGNGLRGLKPYALHSGLALPCASVAVKSAPASKSARTTSPPFLFDIEIETLPQSGIK
jgi:hypothetical protein